MYYTDSTTVVVVPLTALQHDLHNRCLQQGLPSAIWSGQVPPSLVQVVFVHPEAALSPTFGTFLNRLQGLHQLDRTVIDECHVVLNQQAEFRPTLQRLGELSRLAVQMVLLTATLPPRLESLLWTRMFFDAKEVVMFRDRTTRANIAYQVISTQSRTEARATLLSMVPSLLGSLAPAKLLVYRNSREETMELTRETAVQSSCKSAKRRLVTITGNLPASFTRYRERLRPLLLSSSSSSSSSLSSASSSTYILSWMVHLIFQRIAA